MRYHQSFLQTCFLLMTFRGPATPDTSLRWEEGDVDHRQEHLLLTHEDVPGRPVALVGPRQPVGLRVRFMPDLPDPVARDVRDELWSWCTPQPDDPWFAADLWFHLVEYALDKHQTPGPIRWSFVPRRSTPGSDPPFVEDVTALYRRWVRHAESQLSGPEEEVKRKQAACASFLRDYVALFALVGGEPRQAVGRLARLVRLQTGDDPTARFDVRLVGEEVGDISIRVGHIEDFDFADAWACAPFEGFVITKIGRPGHEDAKLRWSRGEVRALLRYIDMSLASEVPGAGLLAEVEGPILSVRLCADGA